MLYLVLFLAVSLLPAEEAVTDTAKTAVKINGSAEQIGEAAAQMKESAAQISEVAKQVDEIHENVVRSPLENKTIGIELNPLSLLFIDKGYGIAGTVSVFSWKRTAEIAFPVMLEQQGDGGNGSFVFNADAHYRQFLSGRQRGFYLAGFTRYQSANYHEFSFTNNTGQEKSLNRMGLGFGIGSRIFSRSGWYWGWSLSLGRFLIGGKVGDDELPDIFSLWSKDFIFDFELLKIGFAF